MEFTKYLLLLFFPLFVIFICNNKKYVVKNCRHSNNLDPTTLGFDNQQSLCDEDKETKIVSILMNKKKQEQLKY